MTEEKREKILLIFGTRPEAIKIAPLITELSQSEKIKVEVCVTGQHRNMLDQVLRLYKITPKFDLDVMTQGQSLAELTSKIIARLEKVLKRSKPDWVFVHGDTTTAFAASVVAYYNKIKIAHVEAGLRTYDISSPWPEEGNRQLISRVTNIHFAPTEEAKRNLLSEGVPDIRILVSGNTVIDALLGVSEKIDNNTKLSASLGEQFPFINEKKKLILVTGHRRENFGAGLKSICEALTQIAKNNEVEIVYPVHLNPNVRKPVIRELGHKKNIHLLDPLDYLPFVYLMKKAFLVLTDSGGIQEEAPSLGKPVLVMRNTTERPEAIAAGTAILVGTDSITIIKKTEDLLNNSEKYRKMAKSDNPYGDGNASKKIRAFFESEIK